MSRLSPKPAHTVVKKTWEDLDKLLISNFASTSSDYPQATIDHTDYEMPLEEIIQEAEKQGYLVTVSGDHVTFE